MATVVAQAPAKVNLWLAVGPPREDGYHGLATVFQSLSLRDTVAASEAAPGSGITISVEGADGVPLDRTNLAWLAAEAVADAAGVASDVSLHLSKRIPVAGGMAGGSADAAATLVACDALWGAKLGRPRLLELAAGLGSDVPAVLHGGTVAGSDRGDVLAPVLARGGYHWVVAAVPGGLSTPAVFHALDRMRADQAVPEPRLPDALLAALRAGDPVALGAALGNDLQAAAISLRPELARLLAAGTEAGALGSMVSGSGPTCVFLARDADHAVDLTVALSGSGLCRMALPAQGPVSGAAVIDHSRSA